MSSNFVIIPILALLCYVILMLAFLAAKKNRLIMSFMELLGFLILWTLGSFCMRQNLYPSYTFWYHVSITGLFLLGYGFYSFISNYVESKKRCWSRLWFVLSVGMIVINMVTNGFFMAPPKKVMENGAEVFIYETSLVVILPFVIMAIIVVQICKMLFAYSKSNEMVKSEILPIVAGIACLFFGNLATAFSFMKGFPIDILSGLLNAILMFYALYQKRLFRLTLLVSRSCCYVIAACLGVLVFGNAIPQVEAFIAKYLKTYTGYTSLMIAITFSLSVLLFYALIKQFVDRVFAKEELMQAERLKIFSTEIAKTLDVDEILQKLIDTTRQMITVSKIYVCIKNYENEEFVIEKSSSPLDERNMTLRMDNPIVVWLQKHQTSLLMKDFKKTTAYKAMWESEKEQLIRLNVECMLPLIDEGDLVGIVFLSGKAKGAAYTYDDLNFMESLSSVSSIAVRNSKLYEKVYLEARTDELTGLLNRKYFYKELEEAYRQCGDYALSLLIVDLDDFKLFNQLYGMAEGDKTLKNVANIISGTVGSNGIVSRYEGKAFAVILPGYDILSTRSLAEVIRSQVMDMNKKDAEYSMKMLTVSCGICSIPAGAVNTAQLVANADMAVYNAKRSGKNCTVLYSEGILGIDHGKSAAESALYNPDVYSEYAATVYALTAAIDAKDHYTFNHSQNVMYYATELARNYGLSADSIEIVKEAALLHDIGKIGIPEKVLNKPGKLTGEEYDIMKGHVEQAIGIIRHLPSMDYVVPAVLGHHERYDGMGYPRGLKGEDIPLLARVLCVADSFDAMVSRRTYKDAFTLEYAIQELEENSGRQFDPVLAQLFINMLRSHRIEVRH